MDRTSVKVKGGNGGNGMIAFTSYFGKELAGPDGGDGGNGGHVLFKANKDIKSLSQIKKEYKGEAGENGESCSMVGKSGEHLIIDVPVGTLVKIPPVYIEDPNLKDVKLKDITIVTATKTVADLDEHGFMFLAAKGGTGGKGNQFFLTNENRHPRIAEAGANGEDLVYLLEMKVIAHIGLVGFPNVGKSTLLSAVSRAKPKVENEEFTTKRPNIGIVDFDDYTQIAIADLPGLIEDAHLNRGLGIAFLRHLERCVCLMYVIDLSKEDPVYQFEILKKELEFYKKGLSKRPHAIVGAKIDLPNSTKNLELLKSYLREHTPENEIPIPVISCSGKYGKNLKEFLNHCRGLYDLYNKPEVDEPGFEW